MPVENSKIVPLPVDPALIPTPASVDPNAIAPFVDCLPIPPVQDLTASTEDITPCHVVLTNKLVQVHSALGRTTPVWSYDIKDSANGWKAADSYFGPTLVVRKQQKVEVTYENCIHGKLPFCVLQTKLNGDPNSATIDPLTANAPGNAIVPPPTKATISEIPGSADLYAWTVTHLHGGRTAAMYDGWTENAMLPPRQEGGSKSPMLPGETQVSVYENDQAATMLWYHDHAMGVTRLNVLAGLAGAYIITDEEETECLKEAGIVLPSGDREIPLIIQDRNLETDQNTGKLTGRFVHKTSTGTGEYFAPYTVVNGVIWPKKEVERARYRLRFLNGSNARAYCLKALAIKADGTQTQIDLNCFMRQIGSDGGLLTAPVKLPDGSVPTSVNGTPVDPNYPVTDGLLLASSERADVYVDFSLVPADVKSIVIVNTAFAPFHRNTVDHPNGEPLPDGTPAPDKLDAGTALPELRLPYPNVMRFDLVAATSPDPATDLIKPPNPVQFKPIEFFAPNSLADLPTDMETPKPRLVILVEDPGGMLMMFEMARNSVEIQKAFKPLLSDALINIKDTAGNTDTYVPIATRFEDRVAFFPRYGAWDVWQVLNLTVDTHPFHVHLVEFKTLQRQPVTFDAPTPLPPWAPLDPPYVPTVTLQPPLLPDLNERGWKDTVRINPNEMLTFAAKFDGFTGRYMYHCHILEHEDHEMMRPFVVVPDAVMRLTPDMPMLDGTDLMKSDDNMNMPGM